MSVDSCIGAHELEPPPPPLELGIYAVFLGNRYLSHRAQVLLNYLAERIGPQPPWDVILPR